ncbi:MAG: hypothetical protein ACFFE8_15990 [Candidatus Heimdallarchaeota archaeon]
MLTFEFKERDTTQVELIDHKVYSQHLRLKHAIAVRPQQQECYSKHNKLPGFELLPGLWCGNWDTEPRSLDSTL